MTEAHARKGFVVLPRRWVMEKMISWLDQNRKMSKDCERLASSSEAFIHVAMSCLIVRGLACTQLFLNSFLTHSG